MDLKLSPHCDMQESNIGHGRLIEGETIKRIFIMKERKFDLNDNRHGRLRPA